ncbi:hypothetical protein ABZ372_56015, partial [Streptomyces sp. NPDC005921]
MNRRKPDRRRSAKSALDVDGPVELGQGAGVGRLRPKLPGARLRGFDQPGCRPGPIARNWWAGRLLPPAGP